MVLRQAQDEYRLGLSSDEAERRLGRFGFNELKKPRELTRLRIFISQFRSPLIYILVFAGLATLVIGELTDSTVIFLAVLLNIVLGFYQEHKAQRALEALRGFLAPKAKVIRDGEQKILDARTVVPGDLAVLTIGDQVPADGVLMEATDLSVDEAILTGEAMPVVKIANRKNGVFMGTTVVAGIGKMVVTTTGMETEMGKIGRAVEEVEEEKTPLQKQLENLAKILGMVIGGITLGIFTFGRFLGYQPLEMFTTSVAVAVAAIPEGLVITVTVILALGMQRVLRRKALVRKLLAAETLGSVSVICVDKTGTLTEGKLKVVKEVTEISEEAKDKGDKLDWLIKAAVLCNDLRDPLETTMLRWAEEKLSNEEIKKLREDYQRLDEIPFSPKYKYIATLHGNTGTREHEDTRVLFFSGAPEVVLSKCKEQRTEGKDWLEKFEECGSQGYRLVGFAYKKMSDRQDSIREGDLESLEWLGILLYEDPVREGIKEALGECQSAGVKVKVVTGDYLPTAVAVLKKIGLNEVNQVLIGDQLEKMSAEELKNEVGGIVLFARTNPEQKLKIVQALKDKGEVVAMMGDGVNDAPALAKADIGIVVDEASDVARETADMVLLDSNFATIVHAIEEGRVIFENIRKVTLYLLSCSFTEIILIGGSLILKLPLPVTATQILWVNLLQDTFPAIALAFDPKEKYLMSELPRNPQTSILNLPMRVLIFTVGILTNFLLLGLVAAIWKGWLPFRFNQTMFFVALGLTSTFIVFSCRSLRSSVFSYNPFANKFLNLSVMIGFLMLILAVYFPPLQHLFKTQPLAVAEWVFLFFLGLFNLLAIEVTKWVFLILPKKESGLLK